MDRSAPPTLVDRLADVLLFAPIGLVSEASDTVPDLAERGRRRVRSQVAMARFLGEVAVRKAERALEGWTEHHRTPAPGADHDSPSEPAPEPAEELGATLAEPVPAAADLALTDYDTLAAAQVIMRLEGLSAAELAAIGRYERAHRGRKTILGKLSQLS